MPKHPTKAPAPSARAKIIEHPIKPPTAEEWREGKKRALALIRELNRIGLSELDVADDMRDGRPQQNLVYAHLFGLFSTKSWGVMAAFSSIMSQYLGWLVVGDDPADVKRHVKGSTPRMIWPFNSNAMIAMRPFGKSVAPWTAN